MILGILTYAYTHVYIYIYIYVCVCIYIYIYIHIYIYVYIHVMLDIIKDYSAYRQGYSFSEPSQSAQFAIGMFCVAQFSEFHR